MFKDKLKQLRTEKGYTQSDVANAIGVTAATIGNYEQGSRQPRGDEAWQKLADFLEVSVDELMDKKKTIRWADVKDDPKYKNMKITIKQPKYTVPKDLKNNLREECRIIYKKIEGFKIPIESIVEENNILGVYVINEETKMPEFVSLNKNFYKLFLILKNNV